MAQEIEALDKRKKEGASEVNRRQQLIGPLVSLACTTAAAETKAARPFTRVRCVATDDVVRQYEDALRASDVRMALAVKPS